MNKNYNLKLDLQFRCNNSTMKFNQFDNNTSDFFMRITNGGKLIDIEKAIVVLAVIKPSGKVSSQFVEVKNDIIYADLKASMKDEIGTYTAKAMLVLEDERVVTDTISYEVEEDKIFALLNDTVEATEDFTLLTDMLNRLSTIEISEEQRMINEAERILSEENRKIEEAKRVETELIRQHEEADRAKYDATRESNENIRKQNESIRLANETNRIDEEVKRAEEENKRKLAEEERKANYNFMTEDEERRRSEANAHKEAEVLRVQAETNRVNEEAKRRTTEQARVSAENTRVGNENVREANEVTRKNNETQRIEAETQRQNRYNSFITEAEANANNFENYTNNAKASEEERKANELDRKLQEDRRLSNEIERITNENNRKANEITRIEAEKLRVDAENLRKETINEMQNDYDSLKKVMIDENSSANLQNQINSFANLKADKSYVDNITKSLASGSPKGVYSTVSALTSAIPNGNDNVYVVTADGCWYYWNGSSWAKGGLYQSTGISDGTISFDMLNSAMKSNASKFSDFHIHLPHSSSIDIDEINEVIRIPQDAIITFTRLDGRKSYSAIPSAEVSYKGILGEGITFCGNLLYNVETKIWSILNHSKTPNDNEVIVASIRVTNQSASDCWYVTSQGRPNNIMQKIINAGLLTSEYHNVCMKPEGLYQPVYIDRVANIVKVPSGTWVTAGGVITVEAHEFEIENKTAQLYAFYYDKTLGRFDLQHYNSKYKGDIANHILVDMVHLNNSNSSFSVFTDDIFVFEEQDNVRYIPVKDMFNFEVVKPTRNYQIFTRFSVNNVIVRTDSADTVGGYNRFRLSHRVKNGVISDAVRIRKKDGITALKISGGNPKYNYALHIMYNNIEEDKMSYAIDTGWAVCNSVKTYDLASLFEKYSDTLYIVPLIRYEDNSVHIISDIENLELTVKPIYANSKDFDSPIIDLDIMLSEEFVAPTEWTTRGRGYITDFIPFNATQCIRVSSNAVTTRNYNGKDLSNILSFHGYDKNKKRIFDSYWQGSILTSSSGYNPLKYWDNRYINGSSVQSKEALIEQLAYCKIFLGTDKYAGTQEDYKNYIDTFINDVSYGLKYVSKDEGLFDYNMVESNSIIEAYSKNSGNDGGAADNIVSLREEFIFNLTSGQPKFKSIEVPSGYRAYNVEFAAKVSNGYSYVNAGDAQIQVINTKYKRFKFRVNKAENKGLIVTPSLTLGTASSLYVKDVKITPIREDIQVLPHTNNRFYMHRGYSTVYPENSLLAAEEACKRGCSMIELDLFSSTDNKPLFIHDDTLGRTDRNRPTITFDDPSLFSRSANNKITVNSSIINEFEVNDSLAITDNGVSRTGTVISVSGNVITLNISTLTGPITKIVNNRRLVNTCSEAEFLEYEIGEGEYNATFEDYLNVLSRFNASFIMDIRQLTELCFKEGMAPLMDRFKYWDNVYFMHNVSSMTNYDKWAGDINRKIRTASILWTSGDSLLNEIRTYGETDCPNTISKDVVLNSPNVTQEAIDLAHSYGMRVMVFTINSVNSAQQFFRMGVDICASDCLSDDNCILW